MTQTVETATSSTHPSTDPQTRADRWFDDFEEALTARDVERAAGMFATESYWRDLIAFSWNITTVEGREGVADLLGNTLDGVDPSGFATSEPADEADGVTTAWFTFETAVGRGTGLLRLVDEDGPKAFTLLTTMHELKGHEEPKGGLRPWVPSTAPTSTAAPGWRSVSGRPKTSARPPSPTCWWSAAGRAGSHSGRGSASSGCRVS